MENALVWHYTTGQKIEAIAQSGILIPSPHVDGPDELPVLWFSSNNRWEPTATKMTKRPDGSFRIMTWDEMLKHTGGLFRFGYPKSKLMGWNELRKAAKIPFKVVKRLETAAYMQGANPSHWMGCLDPITCGDPELVLEQLDGESRWIRLERNSKTK